ncbi:MAG: hypothetical protein ACKN9T_16840 [Candidatus Methylumidiphilus sp.]
MQLKLNVGGGVPVGAEAAVVVNLQQKLVFSFIVGNFHENYVKWMSNIVELEFFNGVPIDKGHKVRQVRVENNEQITSVFEIIDCDLWDNFVFEGKDSPYRQIYRMEMLSSEQTKVTFRFELLELEFFMRPFVKLIRVAMVEGVESTIETLANLLNQESLKQKT